MAASPQHLLSSIFPDIRLACESGAVLAVEPVRQVLHRLCNASARPHRIKYYPHVSASQYQNVAFCLPICAEDSFTCSSISFWCNCVNMVNLRSFVFMICFYFGSVLLAISLLPLLVSRQSASLAGRIWGRFCVLCCHIVGLTHKCEGDMALGEQVIYAVKHQSAWETLVI